MKLNKELLSNVKRQMKALLKDEGRMDALSLKDNLRYSVEGLPPYMEPYVEQARQDLGIKQVYEDAGTGRIKVFVKSF